MDTVYKMIVENNVVYPNELNNSFRLPKDELEKIISKSIFDIKSTEKTTPILRLVKQ